MFSRIFESLKIQDKVSHNDEYKIRYQSLTDNLAASVVIRDCHGKTTYCSPYTEVLTGYSLQEIYNNPDFFIESAHEEDRSLYKRALKICASGELFNFKHRFFHKTGIEMWGETRTVPIFDTKGEISSFLSITLDVTSMVRNQKQIEEKNSSLRDFTYMVSHDLKAPISTIKGMLNILQTEMPNFQGDNLVALEHIIKATTRLESLVGSVLEYSKASNDNLSLGPVELNEIIPEVINDHQTAINNSKAKISIQDLPLIHGEKLKVYQIFSNLIGNALKYRDLKRPLEINIYQDKTNTRLANIIVEDNGCGIPNDKNDKFESIFRPFARAHSGNVEGSGIGLACVKKLVERHGGEIKVESTVGQGSKFCVSFLRLAKQAG